MSALSYDKERTSRSVRVSKTRVVLVRAKEYVGWRVMRCCTAEGFFRRPCNGYAGGCVVLVTDSFLHRSAQRTSRPVSHSRFRANQA